MLGLSGIAVLLHFTLPFVQKNVQLPPECDYNVFVSALETRSLLLQPNGLRRPKWPCGSLGFQLSTRIDLFIGRHIYLKVFQAQK